MGAARFKGYVKCRPGRTIASLVSVPKRFNFGVRLAGAVMPAAADDVAAFYQDGADHRIGGCQAKTAMSEAERQAHERQIG